MEIINDEDDSIMIADHLFECLKTSSDYEMRLGALKTLLGMTASMRWHIGTVGLNLFEEILSHPDEDPEIISFILQIFNRSLTPEEDVPVSRDKVGENISDLMIASNNLLNLILNLTGSSDISVRLPLLHFLISLLRFRASDVQLAVINHPNGVPKVVDLLKSDNIEVRNNVILMISELSRGSRNIQQLLVYEKTFEKLLNIVENELSDSIVIEDCLFVILNLLKKNAANQKYFREEANLNPELTKNLIRFFSADEDAYETFDNTLEWPKQRVSNIFFGLECIRTLVSIDNEHENTLKCQKSLYQNNMLASLCEVMFFEPNAGLDVIVQTILTVSEIIRGNYINQAYFSEILIDHGDVRESALKVLMDNLSDDTQKFKLRCASIYIFTCYMYDNDFGKNQILKTLDVKRHSTVENYKGIGTTILTALDSSESFQVWGSLICLMHILFSNDEGKNVLLNIKSSSGAKETSLFVYILSLLRRQEKRRGQIKSGILMLLSIWINNCKDAVQTFMRDSQNIQYLVSEFADISHDGNESEQRTIKGLLAFFIMTLHDNLIETSQKKAIFDVINRHIGKSVLADALENFTHNDYYLVSASKSQIHLKTASNLYLDFQFCKIFKVKMIQFLKVLRDEVDTTTITIDMQEGAVVGYIELIRKQDAELLTYKQDLKENKEKLSDIEKKYSSLNISTKDEISHLRSEVEKLKKDADEKKIYEEQIAILSSNVTLWQAEVQKYKDWANQWQKYQISQLPNPTSDVIRELEVHVDQLNEQLMAGYQAYETQGVALANAMKELKGKDDVINKMKHM
uniref:Uso1_p115_head domain-containing protein n=1 Tax=Rhabditophanes sp. KR3021 TaxID=114890 RepID=A0AC35U6U2_9BILA